MTADPRRGLHGSDDHPGPTWGGAAAGAGSVWGLFGYSVLWDGAPFSVDRPFVQSVVGTFVLLPIRTALWAIHLVETAFGRTFDFSANHWWIGVLAAVIGSAFTLGALWMARRVVRWVRAARG